MKLKNYTAIVTGSGRGIGKATAILLAREGANVIVTARTEKEIKETEAEINSFGNAFAIKADVSKISDVKKVVEATIDKFKHINILINNAGVAIHKPLIETTEEEFDKVINTNLKGIFLFTKSVLPFMIKQSNGVIVNISSGAGKYGFKNFSIYCSSKFAVNGLTESLAREVENYAIRVYSMCPGAVDTKMQKDISPKLYKFGRIFMLKPNEVAEKVLELCLPDCKIKSGSAIDI